MHDPSEPLTGDLIAAVDILCDVFERRSIRYALFGGLATMLRGRPRFTQDIDVLADIAQIQLPGLLDELVGLGFSIDRDTVIHELRQHRMAAFRFGVVRVDWLKPVLPLYSHALAAATSLPWTPGHSVRVLTTEGLIVTKMVAFRPQDMEDIRTLIAANATTLDLDLIRREWATVADDEEERTAWLEKALQEAGKRPQDRT